MFVFVAMVTDIAVGAYLSDSAFLMFGQSIINMNMTISISVTQIDPYPEEGNPNQCMSPDGSVMLPCFNLDICFKYSYSRISRISK